MRALTIAALAVGLVPLELRGQATALDQAVAACASIERIGYHEYAYDRYGDVGRWGGGHRELDALSALAMPVADLDTMLRSADPKARTLALLLLFDREEPELLPRIAAWLGDATSTFPAETRTVGGLPEEPPYHDEPITVGGVAQLLLDMWYHASNTQRTDIDLVRAFDTWWRTHGKHRRGGVWMRLRLLRATGGFGGRIPDGFHPRIAKVRAAVDTMPSPQRELLMIALPDLDLGVGALLATDAERIAAAERLGDDALLRVLRGEFPDDDPCWPQWFCQGGVFGSGSALHRFLLTPQHRIFAPSAAARLLELEAEQRRRSQGTSCIVDTGWAITAASLRPEHATQWLTEALDRFAEPHGGWWRAQLLRALVQFGDEPSEATVVERFWRDDLTFFGKTARGEVLLALPDTAPAKARRVLAAIVAAPPFQSCDPPSVIEVGKAAGKLQNTRLVPDDAEQSLPHPMVLDRMMTPEQRAAEIERVAALVQGWRDAIVKAMR